MRCLLLISLLLTACAPVIVTAPAGGDVLPAEAQRVIDRATATAAAYATAQAEQRATAEAARVTATAAYQQTQGALGVEQTRVALRVTEAEILAEQTRAAVVLAITQEAARNRSIAEEIRQQQARARAESWAAFWSAMGEALVAMLWIAGLSASVFFMGSLGLMAWTRYLQARAYIAREAFKVLPPDHYAEYQPGTGYTVRTLPALPAPEAESGVMVIDAYADPQKRGGWYHDWMMAYRRYAFWGDRYGFGIRNLGPMGVGVVSDPDWRILHDGMVERAVLEVRVIERAGRRVRVTSWAASTLDDPGWNLARFLSEFGTALLLIPFPKDQDAPKVAEFVPTQHAQAVPTTQTHDTVVVID